MNNSSSSRVIMNNSRSSDSPWEEIITAWRKRQYMHNVPRHNI